MDRTGSPVPFVGCPNKPVSTVPVHGPDGSLSTISNLETTITLPQTPDAALGHIPGLPNNTNATPGYTTRSPLGSQSSSEISKQRFSLCGLSNGEKGTASLLFDFDTVDLTDGSGDLSGSDAVLVDRSPRESTLTADQKQCYRLPLVVPHPLRSSDPPIQSPSSPSWDELTVGVQWMLLKLLRKRLSLATAMSGLLRLTQDQVRAFTRAYLQAHQEWQDFEEKISEKSWESVEKVAQQLNTTVLQLLHDKRPELPTDRLPSTDINRGVAFLKSRMLDDLASELAEWTDTGKKDYLYLGLEVDIVMDFEMRQYLSSAVSRGIVNLQELEKQLAERRERRIMGRTGTPLSIPSSSAEDSPEGPIGSHQHGNQRSSPFTAKFNGLMSGDKRQVVRVIHAIFPDSLPDTVSGRSVGTVLERGRRPSPPTQRKPRGTPDQQQPQAGRSIGTGPGSSQHQGQPTPTPSNYSPIPSSVAVGQGQAYQQPSNQGSTNSATSAASASPANHIHNPSAVPPSMMNQAQGSSSMIVPVSQAQESTTQDTPSIAAEDPERTSGVRNHTIIVDSIVRKFSGNVAFFRSPPASPEPPVAPGEEWDISQLPTARVGHLSSINRGISLSSPNNGGSLNATPTPGSHPGSSLFRTQRTQNSPLLPTQPLPTALNGQPPMQNILTDASVIVPPPSVQLRQLLDDRYRHYLNPVPKKPSTKTPKGIASQASTHAGTHEQPDDDDSEIIIPVDEASDEEYTPEKRKPKRKKTTKAQEDNNAPADKFTTARLKETGPPQKKRKQDHKDMDRDADTVVCAGQHISANALGEAAPEVASEHIPTSNTRGRPPVHGKNSERLFGMYRHQPLESGIGRVQTAHYAWSADSAEFAAVATTAQFAYTADRLVPPPQNLAAQGPAPVTAKNKALTRMHILRSNYVEAEQKARADPASNAEVAKFAGCADRAKFAIEAETAHFALKVKHAGVPDGWQHTQPGPGPL